MAKVVTIANPENIVLQENVPVENLEIVVNVPNGTELNYKLLNSESQVRIAKKEAYTQYTWKFKNMHGVKQEANQPHDRSFLPRLIFSNLNMPDAIKKVHSDLNLELSNHIKGSVKNRISGMKK